MRGKITDQDLTNYALNDGLDPRERLYVESMLAVSEECRSDIYRMIDLGQMLETGFQQEGDLAAAGLTAEQRIALLHPKPGYGRFVRRAVATMAAAACVAFAIVNPQFWQGRLSMHNVAKVSSQMHQMVSSAVSSNQDVDFASLVDLHEIVDDSSLWLQTAAPDPSGTMVCTPPSWLDSSDFGDFR